MSNYGFTGKALQDERIDHPTECPARHSVNDLSDCQCGLTAARVSGGKVVREMPVAHAPDFYRDLAERAAAKGFAQVWCDKCDQPATRAIPLTNGSTAFRCSTHAWALVAPRGQS